MGTFSGGYEQLSNDGQLPPPSADPNRGMVTAGTGGQGSSTSYNSYNPPSSVEAADARAAEPSAQQPSGGTGQRLGGNNNRQLSAAGIRAQRLAAVEQANSQPA